ncbi:signal peptide peptidase SppA [Helicobacter pametensis]|uniref:signal peptide peptidase SppA n=1 Tax=Helicobacter pametensis TaxID=95149 RepID=UPI0004ACD0A9|nr:signal peptide peptidase SppA [Helicobacter pametensis]
METLRTIIRYLTKPLDFAMKYFKLIVLLLIIALFWGSGNETQNSQANLAKLYLRGPIFQSDDFREQIERIKSHPNIKGALLIIDSPGGAVGPSIEIANLVKELRDVMPVIAHVEGVMASGGYYGGMYSDKIIANRGAIIGSIGVVIEGFNIKPLLDKIGIGSQTLQEGEYKRIGTPLRTWKENEKKFLQNFLEEQYKMFVNDVIQARSLSNNDPKVFADGKIFSAQTALKLGLIDAIGSQNQAIKELSEIAQVSKPIWLEKSKTQEWLDRLSHTSLTLLSNFFRENIR